MIGRDGCVYIVQYYNLIRNMTFLKVITILYCVVYSCGLTKAKSCRGTASYTLAFQAEWKNSTRPSNAQFSSLIGSTHNRCYQMWQPGKKASLGVQQVAENGDSVQLYKTLLDLRHDKTVSNLIQSNQNIDAEGHVIFPESNVTGGGFLVDGSHSFVSIITALLPSPDWFIGVHNIDLCDVSSGGWRSNETIFLFPYDAGTVSGTELNNSFNKPTNPRRKITRVERTQWSDSERGMGYFHFTLISKTPRSELDETVTDEVKCVASLMKWSSGLLLAIMIMILR